MAFDLLALALTLSLVTLLDFFAPPLEAIEVEAPPTDTLLAVLGVVTLGAVSGAVLCCGTAALGKVTSMDGVSHLEPKGSFEGLGKRIVERTQR